MRNAIKFRSRVEDNFSLNCQRFVQILNACQQIPAKTINENEREVEDLRRDYQWWFTHVEGWKG